jgi:hypothetical protein
MCSRSTALLPKRHDIMLLQQVYFLCPCQRRLTGEEKTWIRLAMLWSFPRLRQTTHCRHYFEFSSVVTQSLIGRSPKLGPYTINTSRILASFFKCVPAEVRSENRCFETFSSVSVWTVSDISKYRSVSLFNSQAVNNVLGVLTNLSFKPTFHCHTGDEFYRSSLYLQINCLT